MDNNIPTKDDNLHDHDSERKSLANNRAENSINTRDMRGPNTYQPNKSLDLSNVSDLPNIDIGFSGLNNYNNSQRSNPNNLSNRSYQNQPALDKPYQPNEAQVKNNAGKGRVQFPTRVNRPPNQQQQQKQQQPQQQQQQQPQQQNSQRYMPSKRSKKKLIKIALFYLSLKFFIQHKR